MKLLPRPKKGFLKNADCVCQGPSFKAALLQQGDSPLNWLGSSFLESPSDHCPTSKIAGLMAPITGEVFPLGMRVLIAVLRGMTPLVTLNFLLLELELNLVVVHFFSVVKYVVKLIFVALMIPK